MEYMLRGGQSGLDLYMNCPMWAHGRMDIHSPGSWFVLVDGKQRLDAALGFLNNEFSVFGSYYHEFEDHPRCMVANFRWHVNDLQTREECLQWYLDLNRGGTVHSQEELDRVRDLIPKQAGYQRPSPENILLQANLDRKILKVVQQEHLEEEARDKAAHVARQLAEAAKKSRGGKRKK